MLVALQVIIEKTIEMDGQAFVRVRWTEHRTDESILLHQRVSRICCTSQTLLLWTHNERRRVRAGEVRDPGESEREAKVRKTNVRTDG